jgi:hypothetical protein
MADTGRDAPQRESPPTLELTPRTRPLYPLIGAPQTPPELGEKRGSSSPSGSAECARSRGKRSIWFCRKQCQIGPRWRQAIGHEGGRQVCLPGAHDRCKVRDPTVKQKPGRRILTAPQRPMPTARVPVVVAKAEAFVPEALSRIRRTRRMGVDKAAILIRIRLCHSAIRKRTRRRAGGVSKTLEGGVVCGGFAQHIAASGSRT